MQSRYDQLCMLDEKRLKALYHIQGYQRRLRKAFDKKVERFNAKIDPSLDSRNKREVQEKLGRPIYYQAYILWGSSKIDGLKCKTFH